jgi:hypothetical protein
MSLFRRKPKSPSKLDRQLALALAEDAMARVQQNPEPPRFCTRAGKVAHFVTDGRSACPDMAGWTDWDLSDEGRGRAYTLPLCRRCQTAHERRRGAGAA